MSTPIDHALTSQSTNSLYSEVETLASLSDALQTQLSSKVFDMRDADGRLSRLATEKAKADNKYFQAMRTKEAIEAECRTAQRSVEKQARLLEKALEVEKSLQAQTAAQEKQVTGMKNEMQDLQGKWVKEQEGKREGEARLMAAQASLAEVCPLSTEFWLDSVWECRSAFAWRSGVWDVATDHNLALPVWHGCLPGMSARKQRHGPKLTL